MVAYLLVLLGVFSRYMVAGHLPLLNFTAVTGSLLYFGARRSWREMLAPLAVFMLSDYCLTTFTYHSAFHWQSYGITWTWYVAVMVLGAILLQQKTSFARGIAATLIGPTGFFLVSNFGVWAGAAMIIRKPWPGSEPATSLACPFIAMTSRQPRSFSASRSAYLHLSGG